MPSLLPGAPAVDLPASRSDDSAPKEPQPVSSAPPPSHVENSKSHPLSAPQSTREQQAPEVVEQVLDEETQSALVQAAGEVRLDMPRMSASMASALLTLNAKPSSLSDMLIGSEDGPSLVERAYSQLTSSGSPAQAPYSKSV
ncbi:MAG: hypothetical protein VX593_04185 [Pseudomonadota bacterium]|nr:hypothetical protein [Pseudomonadota bacterium]